MGATQVATDLQNEGVKVIPFGQGFASMTQPTKTFGNLVLQGKIRHGRNPIMRWMFSNCAVEQDAAGNIKVSKKVAREKVDGIIASIMATGRATLSPDANGSVYGERGIITI